MKLLTSTFMVWVIYTHVVVGKPINDMAREPDNDNIKSKNNVSDSNRDMYVVHASVYQIGLITNKTEDEDALNHTGAKGNEEAVTFYRTNGSGIDLSSISDLLLTNVTAQSLLGVAPVDTRAAGAAAPLPWPQLTHFRAQHSVNSEQLRTPRDTYYFEHSDTDLPDEPQYIDDNSERLYKRSSRSKNVELDEEDKTPVKIMSGAAVIPQDAGVQSIAIPPLLIFNNNFTEIPVPIPNTSVVHYAKVNTLIHNVP